jgi:hypothetical protein
MSPARAYNQYHAPRKYTPGKRRFSVYWTWSYPWEANRDVTEMDNRFSTMTEMRRVGWPNWEKEEFSEKMFLQGIAGTLELFHLSIVSFQNVVGEATGQPVPVYQRIDQAGQRLPLDERVLADTDTIMVFGLDHLITEQEASPEEIEALRDFLEREGTCLVLGPQVGHECTSVRLTAWNPARTLRDCLRRLKLEAMPRGEWRAELGLKTTC